MLLMLQNIVLALLTASGCIAYEQLVADNRLFEIALLSFFAYVIISVGLFYSIDYVYRPPSKKIAIHMIFYVLSYGTMPLWYYLTIKNTFIRTALSELLYAPLYAMLAYFFYGSTISIHTFIGACIMVFGFCIVNIH